MSLLCTCNLFCKLLLNIFDSGSVNCLYLYVQAFDQESSVLHASFSSLCLMSSDAKEHIKDNL